MRRLLGTASVAFAILMGGCTPGYVYCWRQQVNVQGHEFWVELSHARCFHIFEGEGDSKKMRGIWMVPDTTDRVATFGYCATAEGVQINVKTAQGKFYKITAPLNGGFEVQESPDWPGGSAVGGG